MQVAFGQVHRRGKTHRRADHDDQRVVGHRLVKLRKSSHRVQGQDGHDQAGCQEHQTRFIALDKSPDRAHNHDQSSPHSPSHVVLRIG